MNMLIVNATCYRNTHILSHSLYSGRSGSGTSLRALLGREPMLALALCNSAYGPAETALGGICAVSMHTLFNRISRLHVVVPMCRFGITRVVGRLRRDPLHHSRTPGIASYCAEDLVCVHVLHDT